MKLEYIHFTDNVRCEVVKLVVLTEKFSGLAGRRDPR